MDHAETDAELLKGYALHGAQDKFAALAARYLPLVYSAALRQLGGDRHRAEDVAQQVFALLGRKARSLVAHPTLSGWLYTSTFHLAQRILREERRRKLREGEAMSIQQQAVDSTPPAAWESIRPLLDTAMLELAERDRVAIIYRFFEGKSYAEIGARLGLAENSARMRVDRALDALYGKLTRRGINSTAAAIGLAISAEAVGAAPTALVASVSSAVPAAGGTSWALLMSSTTLKIASAAAFAGAVLGLVHQHQVVIRQKAEIEQMQSSDRTRDAELQHQLADLRSQLAAAATVNRAHQPATNSKVGTGAALSMEDLVKEHPELRAVYNRMQRANIIRIYGSALTSLGLPADKLAQLESLLADLRFSQNDAREAALAAGLQPGTPEFGDAMRQAQDADRQQILALIGNQGWAQLQQAQFANGYQNQINSTFAPVFQASGVPLNNDQSQALVQAMYDVLNPSVNAAARDPSFSEVDPQTGLSPSDQALIGRASQVLSAGQVAVLKQEISDENQLKAVAGSARVVMH